MKKTPEQYFQEQDFAVLEADINAGHEFTLAEIAFMEKYLGIERSDLKQKNSPLASLKYDDTYIGNGQTLGPPEEPVEQVLKREENMLLVGFFIGNQEFTIPTVAVQEVIKAIPVSKMPISPDFVHGVINLRGRITPLVHLGEMLEVSGYDKKKEGFVIVCRRRGLQFGLMIEKVHTMYRVAQGSIDWAVEAHIGASVEYISGLLKINDMLVSVVSIDKIVERILAE
ncbi:chemotaxis protein CheW [Desulfovibrio litoralis]|uniref:Purine-binding chemotaxis protein CheW n=1 Tax=Desulfovibrio litoralis DSM 11393 TaxID=1121455 RepID=A0A1M7RSN2_9BACT|nr:chemotaxis protein CheW [Desulfovibrio litoralis]SHN49323.1 purine-binding chemotaxis protein CheW [Desulfovibrio litoralis DSM 11393]